MPYARLFTREKKWVELLVLEKDFFVGLERIRKRAAIPAIVAARKFSLIQIRGFARNVKSYCRKTEKRLVQNAAEKR